MKTEMPVVARHSLYEIWAELSPRLQAFLRGQRDVIGELFEETFLKLLPDFAQRYNTEAGQPDGAPIDLWAVEFFDEYTGARLGNVGQLFDEILWPDAGGERIGPEVFDIARADSGGLDRSRGSGPGAPLPLVVLEMRDFGQSKYDLDERPGMFEMIDYPMMMALTDRMADVARRGEAAAEVARRLPASPAGQLVMTWLRRTTAAAEGAGRNWAALILRQEVAAYLARFPGEQTGLEMTLEPFTELLGVSDLVWADRDELGCQALARMLGRVGHQATEPEITGVADLGRRQGMPVGGEKLWLADLAHRIGVRRTVVTVGDGFFPTYSGSVGGRAQVVRLFRLLVLAVSVFGSSASLEQLANLRRLVDLIGDARRAGSGEVRLADLQAEYRRHYGLGDGVPVSMVQLQELAALIGA